jgi:hypothetical protein
MKCATSAKRSVARERGGELGGVGGVACLDGKLRAPGAHLVRRADEGRDLVAPGEALLDEMNAGLAGGAEDEELHGVP